MLSALSASPTSSANHSLARPANHQPPCRGFDYSGGAWTTTAGGLVLDMSAFADIDVDDEMPTSDELLTSQLGAQFIGEEDATE